MAANDKSLIKKDEVRRFEEELLKENAKNLTNPQFMSIKVKHAGVYRFEMPGGSDEKESELLKTFSGIIVYNHRLNSYWSQPFGESENRVPDCFSLDAIRGTVYGECRVCPYNKFGSGRDGKGKACRNMWRLYIFLNKKMLLPYQMTLPPTSLKYFQNYLISLMSQRVPVERVVTRFSIIPGPQDSSIVNFEMKQKLSDEDFLYYIAQRQKLVEFMKSAVFFEEADSVKENDENPKSSTEREPVMGTATYKEDDGLFDDDIPF